MDMSGQKGARTARKHCGGLRKYSQRLAVLRSLPALTASRLRPELSHMP
jgi:hypothetical protein